MTYICHAKQHRWRICSALGAVHIQQGQKFIAAQRCQVHCYCGAHAAHRHTGAQQRHCARVQRARQRSSVALYDLHVQRNLRGGRKKMRENESSERVAEEQSGFLAAPLAGGMHAPLRLSEGSERVFTRDSASSFAASLPGSLPAARSGFARAGHTCKHASVSLADQGRAVHQTRADRADANQDAPKLMGTTAICTEAFSRDETARHAGGVSGFQPRSSQFISSLSLDVTMTTPTHPAALVLHATPTAPSPVSTSTDGASAAVGSASGVTGSFSPHAGVGQLQQQQQQAHTYRQHKHQQQLQQHQQPQPVPVSASAHPSASPSQVFPLSSPSAPHPSLPSHPHGKQRKGPHKQNASTVTATPAPLPLTPLLAAAQALNAGDAVRAAQVLQPQQPGKHKQPHQQQQQQQQQQQLVPQGSSPATQAMIDEQMAANTLHAQQTKQKNLHKQQKAQKQQQQAQQGAQQLPLQQQQQQQQPQQQKGKQSKQKQQPGAGTSTAVAASPASGNPASHPASVSALVTAPATQNKGDKRPSENKQQQQQRPPSASSAAAAAAKAKQSEDARAKAAAIEAGKKRQAEAAAAAAAKVKAEEEAAAKAVAAAEKARKDAIAAAAAAAAAATAAAVELAERISRAKAQYEEERKLAAERLLLRAANAPSAVASSRVAAVSAAVKMDSSIKRCTGFLNKLRQLSEHTRESLVAELRTTNLSKYVSEAVTAVLEARIARPTDVSKLVHLCSVLHQRHEGFSAQLIAGVLKPLASLRAPRPRSKAELSAAEVEDERTNAAKKRTMLRVLTELFFAGISGNETPVATPTAATTAAAAAASKDSSSADAGDAAEHPPLARVIIELLHGIIQRDQTLDSSYAAGMNGDTLTLFCGYIVSFLRYGGEEFTGLVSKKQAAMYLLAISNATSSAESAAAAGTDTATSSNTEVVAMAAVTPSAAVGAVPLVGAKERDVCVRILQRYFDALYARLLRCHERLCKREKRNAQMLLMRGELPADATRERDELRDVFDKLQPNVAALADMLQRDLPELPDVPADDDELATVVSLDADSGADADRAGAAGNFDDEETRAFYEQLPNLELVVPPILLKDGYEKEKAKLRRDRAGQQQAGSGATGAADDDDDADEAESKETGSGAASSAAVSVVQAEDRELEMSLEELEKRMLASDRDEEKSASAAAAAAAAAAIASGSSGERKSHPVELLLSSLSSAYNRETVDDLSAQFCYHNSKANRERVVSYLASAHRSSASSADASLSVLPYYARFVATMHQYSHTIGDALVALLQEEFYRLLRRRDGGAGSTAGGRNDARLRNIRFLVELTQFGVAPSAVIFRCWRACLLTAHPASLTVLCALLETCGRWLYRNSLTHSRCMLLLEQLVALKDRFINDRATVALIEIAIAACKPPVQTAARAPKQRSLLHAFVRQQLFVELTPQTIDAVTLEMRCLPWNDASTRLIITKCLTHVSQVRYGCLTALASVVAALNKWYDVGVCVADAILEELRFALEMPHDTQQQRYLTYARYVSALFSARVIDAQALLDTLYTSITLGHEINPATQQLESTIDPPHDTFRVRLVCTLLEGVEPAALRHGAMRKRLDRFVLYFQRYLLLKQWLPIDLEMQLAALLDKLRPNAQAPHTLQQADQIIADAERARGAAAHKHRDQLLTMQELLATTTQNDAVSTTLPTSSSSLLAAAAAALDADESDDEDEESDEDDEEEGDDDKASVDGEVGDKTHHETVRTAAEDGDEEGDEDEEDDGEEDGDAEGEGDGEDDEDDDEDEEEDDEDDEEDESDEDDSGVWERRRAARTADDDKFDRDFERMMSESVEQRKYTPRTQTLPTVETLIAAAGIERRGREGVQIVAAPAADGSAAAADGSIPPGGGDQMVFRLLTRNVKANRTAGTQAKVLYVPMTDELAQHTLTHDAEAREERADIKRMLLAGLQREEREADSGGGAGEPLALFPHRSFNPSGGSAQSSSSKARYKHQGPALDIKSFAWASPELSRQRFEQKREKVERADARTRAARAGTANAAGGAAGPGAAAGAGAAADNNSRT